MVISGGCPNYAHKALIISSMLLCLSLTSSSEQLNYEQFLKGFVERLPKPLGTSETIADWWPFKDGAEYSYRITDAQWDEDKKWVGTQFTIKFIQYPENKALFQFEVHGYDDFPFSGLQVDKNRVFLLDRNQAPNQIPFLVFPLFKDMLFADINYEHEFLQEMVLNSCDSNFYAPVRSRFVTVSKEEGNLYHLAGAFPRDHFPYTFEKGTGIIIWTLPGGLTIEMVE